MAAVHACPTAMIFDDHDVRDDWNTSAVWRARDGARSRGGATGSGRRWRRTGSTSTSATSRPTSSPPTRTTSRSSAADGDTWPLLVELADRADAEADGDKGVRFSFRWDLGRSRLLMIDSRNGRVLDDGEHLMLGDAEFAWVEEQVDGGRARSTTWCSARRCRGCCRTRSATCRRSTRSPRPGRAGAGRLGEKIRQAADLEHWPAFRESFDRLSRPGRQRPRPAQRARPRSACCPATSTTATPRTRRRAPAAPTRRAPAHLLARAQHHATGSSSPGSGSAWSRRRAG